MFCELSAEKEVDAPINIVRDVVINALLVNEVTIKTNEATSILFQVNPLSGTNLDVFASVSFGNIEFIEKGDKTIVKYGVSFFWVRILASIMTLINLGVWMFYDNFKLPVFIFILIAVWGVLYLGNLIIAADRVSNLFDDVLLEAAKRKQETKTPEGLEFKQPDKP